MEALAEAYESLDGVAVQLAPAKPSLTGPTVVGQSPLVDLAINIAGGVTTSLIIFVVQDVKNKSGLGFKVIKFIKDGIDQTKNVVDSEVSPNP
jgi:hypothetical protein